MSYQSYQEVKSHLAHSYKGYDMAKIMSFDMVYRAYGNRFSLIRDFFSAFLCKKIQFPKQNNHPILFTMGDYGGRKDYYEILNFARSEVPSDFVDVFHARLGISMSVSNFLSSLFLALKSKASLTLAAKLSFAFKICHYRNTIDYIELQKVRVEYKKYCSFCSAHAYEAILDEFFRQRHAPTYTLQHGLYFLFKTPPIDVIAYENMISDNLLCWGEFTKDEFIKFGIPSVRINVAGYPRSTTSLKPYQVQSEQLNILLLCARNKFDQNNESIIKLCHEFVQQYPGTVQLTLKTHPSLNQTRYKQLSQNYGFTFSEGHTIQGLITSGGFDFAIAYNSTAYVDSYLNNLIALHYQDAERENDAEVLNDCFSDADELKAKIETFIPRANQAETWDEIASRLAYLVGCGINRYAEYLDVKETP